MMMVLREGVNIKSGYQYRGEDVLVVRMCHYCECIYYRKGVSDEALSPARRRALPPSG